MAVSPWLVFIPGLGGSKLGWQWTNPPWSFSQPTPLLGRGQTFRRTVWPDGLSGVFNLQYLRLADDGISPYPYTSPKTIDAFGIVPYYYTPMHEWFLQKGFRAIWAHYDWRLRQEDCYREALDQLVAYAEGEPVAIVAHSRGGLIAARIMRELQSQGKLNLVKCLVTIGTPWYGSYTVAPWFGGYVELYGRAAQLALVAGKVLTNLNLLHVCESLVKSFPGVYELLPDPVRAKALGDADVDLLYDSAWWSYKVPDNTDLPHTQSLGVSQAHLTAAKAYRANSTLPPSAVPWMIVASKNYPITSGLTQRNFNLNSARVTGVEDSDGIVPEWSAVPEGKTAVYSDGDHGTMCRSYALFETIRGFINSF